MNTAVVIFILAALLGLGLYLAVTEARRNHDPADHDADPSASDPRAW